MPEIQLEILRKDFLSMGVTIVSAGALQSAGHYTDCKTDSNWAHAIGQMVGMGILG